MDTQGEQPVVDPDNEAARMPDEQALKQGHPNHPKAMRVEALFVAVPLLFGALAAEYATEFPNFIILAPAALVLLWLVVFLPHRRLHQPEQVTRRPRQ